ncbi:MAG: alpha/beta hydrolase [Myxococcota bacterium]|nr:alpha/beta hydrolase [Myxococcota bacterium]
MFDATTFTSFDGCEIQYYTVGTGDTWLVIANGHGATHHVWTDVLERLVLDFKIVIWDYRGQHGSSGTADRSVARVSDHARDAQALMAHLAIDTCIMLGWSLGVQVALESYRRVPDRIHGLVLLHGAHDQLLYRIFGGRLNSAVRLGIHTAGWALPRAQPWLTPLVVRMLNTRFGFKPLQAIGFVSTVTPGLKKMAIELAGLDMGQYMKTVVEAGAHRIEDMLPDVTVPVAITGGTRDWLTPESEITRAFERLPNAAYHQFSGTHFPLAEEPDRVAEIIQQLARYAAE